MTALHDASPYASAQEHARDEVLLIGLLVGRALRRGRAEGWAPGASTEQADGGDAAIVELTRQIEARLVATRRSGRALPFDVLRQRFDLTFGEQRTLWALVAHDIDPRARQLIRALSTETGKGVSVSTLFAFLYDGDRASIGLGELGATSRLLRWRLVDTDADKSLPFGERRLWANARVLDLAHGLVRLDPSVDSIARLIEAPRTWEELRLADATKRQVLDLARSASEATETSPLIVLVGAEGAGRKSLAQGAAVELSLPVLEVACKALPASPEDSIASLRAVLREAQLFGSILVLDSIEELTGDVERGRPDRIEQLDRAGLAEHRGAVFATTSRLCPLKLARGVTLLTVDPPPEAERRELWARAIGDVGAEVLDAAAARYVVTGGTILSAGASAKARADAHGASVTLGDVHEAMRGVIDTRLGGLGLRVVTTQEWSDVVLPEDTLTEVREMIARIRHRRRVFDEWGFGRKVGRGLGLSALFSGDPGTGKTMVAGLIARDLGLDLYQVDLSRVVSKWVGETEKNLSALFAAAESGHAVLLFDEADSLFAKRTEVKSSNDRYANLEVNYLLQRMEAFAGITILTTNHDAAIDDAFQRRLSFRIRFPMPEVDEREQLWRALIPAEANVAPDLDFEELARRYPLCQRD